MNAAREDILSLAVPVGWKLVPVEPTQDMVTAWLKGTRSFQRKYETMLAAAPTPPASEAPGHKPAVIRLLIDLARAAYLALDDSEEHDTETIIETDHADALSALLDKLDALPDDQPGYTMGPAAKAEWALRGMFAAEAPGQEPVAWISAHDASEMAVPASPCRTVTLWRQSTNKEGVALIPFYAAPPTYADAEAKGFGWLQGVLKPFADVAEEYDEREADDFLVWKDAGFSPAITASFKLGNYRRALAAIRSLASPAKEPGQ